MLPLLLTVLDLPAQSFTQRQPQQTILLAHIFYRLPHIWNSLHIINLSQPVNVIKSKLKTFLWNHFLGNFDNIVHVIFIIIVRVLTAASLLQQTILIICNYSIFCR